MASKPARKPRSTTTAIAVLVGAVGAVTVFWFGPRELREARATDGWPVVGGVVSSSGVGERSRHQGSRRWTEYVTEVAYEFEVGGSVYRSTRWSVAGPPTHAERADAEQHARAWRAGDPVEVHFDPEDPSRAVIEVGGEGRAWATIGFGALLLALGPALVLRERRRRAG